MLQITSKWSPDEEIMKVVQGFLVVCAEKSQMQKMQNVKVRVFGLWLRLSRVHL